MRTITLKIAAYEDRNRIVLALANSGYKVWVSGIPHEQMVVRFEYEEGK